MKLPLVYFVFLCLVLSNVSDALPRFSTRQGAKCQSCHINPTGKGMRSTFGATYGREELPMPTFKEQTDIEDFSPSLSDFFTLGYDFRSLFFTEQSTNTNNFFQMQGDLYLDLRLNKKVRIYVDKGLYTGFEVFGLAKVLPLDGYIKVGKFIPAYGTKIDDHNAYIRGGPYSVAPTTGLRFSQRSEDTGLEVGFAPSIFTFNIGVFNGLPGKNSGAPDINKGKVVSLRGEATIQSDLFNVNIGGSFYNDPNNDLNDVRKAQFYGPFIGITFFKTLTYNGEIDYVNTWNTGKQISALATYSELNYALFEGVDLKVGYEFFDPNTNLKTGIYKRFTVGAELFPLSGVEIRPLYRINKEEPNDSKNDEYQLMLHLYL